ncbi:RING finger protein 17 isoform X2 [Achroia grisella]|uniref:RING finger protein 17 isoform X2 n=1 Tax=Achroia grisella TaxID=688607 RepID=UPI0027D28BFC|nr:RING finger protein 17 isoform X2 [Achroia grisella]
METNIQKYCPNCSQLYTLVLNAPKLNNIPLFLSCGHTMCEKCISNIVKFTEPIECRVCHRDMAIDSNDLVLLMQNKIQLYQLFPINVHMLGEIYSQLLNENLVLKKKTGKAANHFLDIKTIIHNIDNTQGECLECHISTSKMCQQCGIILCDPCFNKTHKNFVIFKNHSLKNIEPLNNSNNCTTHKDKSLDYYCKDCLKSICMDCMMVGGVNSCKNHDTVSIQEINETLIEDVNNIYPKVDEIFRRLTKTASDIGHLLYNIENGMDSSCESTQMIANIEQHFSKLISQIQLHKNKLIGVVTKYKYTEKDSLLKAKDDICESIKKTKAVMNIINLTTNPTMLKKTNLSVLLQTAQEIVETPWYLKKEESSDEAMKVVVKEDIVDLIGDYVRLEGNTSEVYSLCATSELGDIEIPPPPPTPVYPPELPKDVRESNKVKEDKPNQKAQPTFYKSAPNYRTKFGSTSSLHSFSNDFMQKPVVQHVQPFAESQHPKQLQEGMQELIYISHIVDPHNFFVQRSCHQPLVKEMMRDFRNAVSLPKPSINHVAEGKLYLVFNKPDNLWQRCRIISIDKRDINKPIFQVFCIDFGSTESVTIDKLRLLPPARLQSPFPLAINCSLANCVPKSGGWTSEDSFLIQNIIDNKQAVIHVRRMCSTSNYSVKLDCDVTTFEDGVNVAHALVYHERAKMLDPKLHYPNIPGVIERPKIFLSNNDLKPKSVEEVYLTTVVSPDKFFVRKRHLQDVYDKLSEDLLQEYSFIDNTGTVYLPEIGMVYAVNLNKSQNITQDGGGWARCIVHELHGRGRVRALLPDSGQLLVVHWTALRKLHPKFTTLKALSIECHLAGVTPHNKKWSTGSVALLQKFEERILELHVEDSRNRGSIGVTLYDKADEENIICINTEMIKHKFAVTFGLFMFNKTNTVEDQVFTNKSPLEEPKKIKKTAKIVILKKQHSPKQKIRDEDLEAKDKGPLRLEAKVLHYTSPSLLYVSLVHQQKVFNELFEKIQKHYTNKKIQGKVEWKVGDRCCTICIQSQTWRRAAIIEIEDNNAKIFYSDFACVETVPIDNLQELTSEFASIGDAAIKCHLCGVIPAVGEEWPSLTKEYLKELLDAYKRVFITKLGNFKDKSMPIEIWVYHTIQGGALEPNKSEWRCLNMKIIDQGLGIPDKLLESSTPDSNKESTDDMLSFLNITGSVREWLQLEPLPSKPLISKRESESCPSSPVDCEESEQAELGVSNTMFISDWLPPEPLQNKEFTGVPTYIDNDGVIYLHDVSQQDTLDLIRKALDIRFKNPDPKAKYAKWTVGEPCIALFFLDNRFYRGRVLEVNNETSTCLIHYIDYGNEEQCSFSNLRKSIALYQIPTQAHKCVLNRIRPAGSQWDRQTLDYIHKSVVEKNCLVKITGEQIDDVIPIDLKYDKLWFNDHLVDFEMAKYTDGSKAIVPKFVVTNIKNKKDTVICESDSGPDYIVEDEHTPLESSQNSSLSGKDWNKLMDEEEEKQCLDGNFVLYPKNTDDEFLCNISIISDINVLELSIIHNDERNILYEDLYANIQKIGYNLSPLNGIFENKACIALFPEDGLWYRASILEYSEAKNRIKVKYVDYGNVEVISLSDVREIPNELADLPPSTVSVQLHGIKINPLVDMDVIIQEYSNTFLGKGPFNAKVITYNDKLPIVELRDDNGVLVCEKLVDNGVLLKI